MSMYKLVLIPVLSALPVFASAQHPTGFKIIENPDKKQVDILFNDKLLTAYCYYDSSRKPILFPVNTIDGITVTRGYPYQPVAGEPTDHPHHTGIWFNYESVNGLDFWNNSTAIAPGKRNQYGTILHQKIITKKTNGNHALLTVAAQWIRPDHKVLLNEQTQFHFSIEENNFIIDRMTTLTATDTSVVFKDVKDGLYAIRVATELEMPSHESTNFTDDKGNSTTVKSSGTDKVTGMYYGSTGLTGDSVWSSKGRWAMLTGKKQGRPITIGIIDHPANIGYPAYWHTRGYGLFSINPLGRKIFSNGTEELNFTLAPHQSATFRYRIIVHSGTVLTKEKMNKLSDDFEKTK